MENLCLQIKIILFKIIHSYSVRFGSAENLSIHKEIRKIMEFATNEIPSKMILMCDQNLFWAALISEDAKYSFL